MVRACPRCGRSNAAHKAKCLYCGVERPDPAPPPAVSAPRELPADLDALVADALAGRGVSRLKAALQSSPSPPPPSVSPAPIAPVAPVPVAPVPVVPVAPPPPPAPPAPPDRAVLLGRAQAALFAAQDRVSEADWDGAQDAVFALREAADALLATLPEAAPAAPGPDPQEPEPEEPAYDPRPALPPVRVPYALFMDGPGDASRAPEVAEALGVDVATARLACASAAARVAIRAADPAPLRSRAERLRACGIAASVISRESLLELPHPALLLSLRSGEPARALSGGPHWLGDPEELLTVAGERVDLSAVRYAVLGEIVIVRTRARAERNRALRQAGGDPTKLDERRLGVIDLWGAGLHSRVVEGFTRIDQPEGRPPFRALVDGLGERFPGLRIEPRRAFQPDARTGPVAAGTTVASSGWPAFDEHTRMCWLHRRDAPEMR